VAVKGYENVVNVFDGRRSLRPEIKVFVKEYLRVYGVEPELDVLKKLLDMDDSRREFELDWLLNTGYMSEHYRDDGASVTGISGKDFKPEMRRIVKAAEGWKNAKEV